MPTEHEVQVIKAIRQLYSETASEAPAKARAALVAIREEVDALMVILETDEKRGWV